MMLQMLQKVKGLRELKQVHLQVILHSLGENNFVLPKLIDLSSAFHSLDYALLIFQNARSRNVVVQNTMIKCFVEKGYQNEAFLTYNKMRASGIPPNNFTFTFLLKACESLESLRWSKGVHCQYLRLGFDSYVFVQNALLNAYAKCSKEVNFAREVFDNMSTRDVVSWNSIIGTYIGYGDIKQAMALFELMPERNVVSWNSVIAGLCRVGDMASARLVFDQMTTRNNISWNTLISGYVMIDDILTAKSIFDQMVDKDVVSWTTMVSACAKIGDLGCARKMFDQMPVKNVVSWNAMIAGYNENSQFNEALNIFQLMLLQRRILPDEATLTSVISSCAQLGSLEHGNWIYSYIKKNKIPLTIPLGNALIDMFAKCGDIKYSELVFNKMPRKCIITWTTMISGFAYNGQCAEALALFKRMSTDQIEPDDVIFISVLSACTHVSNSRALEGKWESVINARSMMHQEGLEKVPGCSSIQVGGEVNEFLVKDTRHKRGKEIYEVLAGLTQVMKQVGYIP
ncbi:pentatricopeptide repeat-containing protein [Canna indica]|uniref:Pentatricopeptide repeat-containing protein n=1 Tax=Canna indica TaxID=4628 RepID=A0AAQ3QDF3_9LILI|nr:pentatricopeptide repeat-containing protein [Canna indica]